MPTVTNYDVLGAVPWGQGRPGTDRDRSDARGGINMLLFDNAGGPCERFGPGGPGPGPPPPVPAAPAPAPEHAYAAAFVSANGYYGFHPQHQDCSMDTSENNLHGDALGALGPLGAFGQPVGQPPTAAAGPGLRLGGLGLPGQHAWHAHPAPAAAAAAAAAQSRKRRPGPGALTDPDGNDHNAKRSKCANGASAPMLGLGLEGSEENHPGASILTQAQVQTHTQALAPGFGVQSSTPSIAHTPTQMYDLPIQQLPGSTSQLADAMTPRPRCLMGHFI